MQSQKNENRINCEMKKIFFLSFFFFLLCGKNHAQNKLEIKIEGLLNSKGTIMLQLFNKNEEVVKEAQQKIDKKHCTIAFSDLPAGTYAVRFFHDANNSGKMETNLFGKPTEGYGFSNNVKGAFGPPPFDKWLFKLQENKAITIQTVY